jgi:S1-C subfamily serine protease
LLEADRSVVPPGAEVVPVKNAAGRPAGLELRGIGEGTVPAALGFEEGDIIESVNGHPVNTPEDLIGLVETLQGAKRVQVRVRRGAGRPTTLRIDVE